MDTGVIIVVTVVGIAVIVIAPILYFYSRQQKKIKVLLDALKAEKTASNTWSFSCGDKKVGLYYQQGGENTPSLVSLSVSGNFQGRCVIRKKTKFDKFIKTLGVGKEIRLLDPEIGELYCMESENDDFIKSLLQKPGIKSILKEILSDFSRIEIENNVCSLVKSPVSLGACTPQQLVIAAQKLIEFVGYIPYSTLSQASLTSQTTDYESNKKIWNGIATGLFIAGIFYFTFRGMRLCHPVYPWQVFRASLWISIPIFFFLAPRAKSQLSHHVGSAQVLARVFFTGGAGLVICSWAALTLLNGFMDTSTPVSHTVRVIDKHIYSDSESGNKYYLTLSPWNSGQRPYNFWVRKPVYNRIPVSADLIINTKKGYFGFEWIPRKGIMFKDVPSQALSR